MVMTITPGGHPVAEGMPPAPPDSLWAHKPWWCQPWSIVLTGVAVVEASWWLLRLWWLSLAIALVVGLWWWLFLLVVPSAYAAEQLADLPPDQNRKR